MRRASPLVKKSSPRSNSSVASGITRKRNCSFRDPNTMVASAASRICLWDPSAKVTVAAYGTLWSLGCSESLNFSLIKLLVAPVSTVAGTRSPASIMVATSLVASTCSEVCDRGHSFTSSDPPPLFSGASGCSFPKQIGSSLLFGLPVDHNPSKIVTVGSYIVPRNDHSVHSVGKLS